MSHVINLRVRLDICSRNTSWLDTNIFARNQRAVTAGVSTHISRGTSCMLYSQHSVLILCQAGGLSAILLGTMMDTEWGKKRRGLIMTVSLLLLLLPLMTLWILNTSSSKVSLAMSVPLLAVIGFSLTGPYSLSAVFTLDLVRSLAR
jgi:sugar phosphate permease